MYLSLEALIKRSYEQQSKAISKTPCRSDIFDALSSSQFSQSYARLLHVLLRALDECDYNTVNQLMGDYPYSVNYIIAEIERIANRR